MLNNTSFLKSLRLLLLGVFLLPLLYTQSSAQYCTATTSVEDEWISGFELNTISNNGTAWQGGVADYTNMSTTLKMGTQYTVTVTNGLAYGSDKVWMWIDYNQDQIFNTSDEQIKLSTSDGAETFTASFTVPVTAMSGTTRLRVRMTYSSDPSPCGSSTYGEVEEYSVNLIPPIADGLVTDVTNPVKPFLVGNYPVVATLKSNNDIAMLACKIDWWVNNQFQGTVNWTGNLKDGATKNVDMGNYNFVYPVDEVNFNPFTLTFTVKDVNNKNPDADPTNDTYTTKISPSLNDCGAIGFFGPPEGFGAGVTQVRARVMNYAPKPLSSVKVYWKVDGVDQAPVTFTGLNIKQNQFADLAMGTFYFYNKTPLGPFSVEVYTESPNGVADENSKNDTYTGGIGPSLSAGIYTVGGSNSHFTSPSEAASYINSSGVFGPGKVRFEIRPGTYTGQVVLNNKLPNSNPIEFVNTGAFASDVVIDANPSSAINYVISLDGMDKISFQNLTIRNNNSNISNAGVLVSAKSVWGLSFNNVNFFGVANSPRYNAQYAVLNLWNCSDVAITNNMFYNGSTSIYNIVSSDILPIIDINHNDFYDFSWLGIYNQIAAGVKIGRVEFADNKFASNSGLVPVGGISSWNSTSILRNQFSNIIGTGGANEAVIFVEHQSPDPTEPAVISNNNITGTNLNGILVRNANAYVSLNTVVMSQSANYGLSVFKADNVSGFVGNNMLMGSNIAGLNIANSPDLWVIYNTSSVDLNNSPAIQVAGTTNIMRNIFVNKGTGNLLNADNVNGIDQNVIYTNGTTLASIGESSYADIHEIHNDGMMLGSSELLVEFFSPSDPHLKVFNADLLFNNPLFNSEDNYQGWLIEANDFDGDERISYYAGMDEILLSISIERQTEGFTDCLGATDNMLSVSSAIGYNAPMTYQWELDNTPIPGATQPLLFFTNLRHSQAGVYRCLVNGPGKTEPIYSREVAVYVARPTDIVRQPETVNVFTGEVAVLSFDAHVNGQNIESAIANDEVEVRWYKYVDEANDLLITDNDVISGAKSNYLTFRNFSAANEGSYYAVVVGLCGEVKTELATISEENLEIVMVRQPIDRAECENGEVILSVDATTKSSAGLSYQWFKDGNAISDNLPKIEGTTSKNLIIYNLEGTDEGSYYVVITLNGTSITEQSSSAALTVRTAPVILLDIKEATVETGKQLVLEMIAEDSYDGVPLNYKWYHDGVLVQDSDDQYYIVEATTANDAGEYYVVIENQCGTTQSATILVTITTGTTSVVEVSNGYSLSTATPNPVQNSSVISFAVPTESFVKITLTDAIGAGTLTIAEGNYSAGTYNVNINAFEHNLSSGTYFYFLESNGVRLSQKLVVVR